MISNSCKILPTLNLLTLETTKACNLSCSYCYLEPSRNDRKQRLSVEMTKKILNDAVCYHSNHGIESDISIVFHGGEALILGHQYYRDVLSYQSQLQSKMGSKKFSFSIQSNITLLDQEYCDIFKDFDVAIGTSIDGPADLHNRNRLGVRGRDNHAKVMEKVTLARRNDLYVGAICIITKDKLTSAKKIFDFFESELINFKINRLFINGQAKKNEYLLNVSDSEYASFACELFDTWYSRQPLIFIENLLQLMGIILAGPAAGSCASGNCASKHITITSNGDCYTCGRTTQDPSFMFGNIRECNFEDISKAPSFVRIASRGPSRINECKNCDLVGVCNAGCMYEAYLKHGTINSPDGNCAVFREIYSHIRNQMFLDLSSQVEKGTSQ